MGVLALDFVKTLCDGPSLVFGNVRGVPSALHRPLAAVVLTAVVIAVGAGGGGCVVGDVAVEEEPGGVIQ